MTFHLDIKEPVSTHDEWLSMLQCVIFKTDRQVNEYWSAIHEYEDLNVVEMAKDTREIHLWITTLEKYSSEHNMKYIHTLLSEAMRYALEACECLNQKSYGNVAACLYEIKKLSKKVLLVIEIHEELPFISMINLAFLMSLLFELL
ncbi:hypothetical protein [Bacillus cereus]|uniref:Uncharacterized protein n=1 Tax=Bacillus cereus TaxID=1396 RepID=A0A164QE67_BACCE|nr:hypothetical protein [Bacillus cereus]KZD71190.1 hypothetical protein B4088_0920 [Bacillus cereus]HDR8321339.1 hypothetical protein [Bacillus cereus]HDR8330987.1 hypothetical protein [Bacillus cereus]HDR8336341.1 hypothetical protein [Bacillus cereus]